MPFSWPTWSPSPRPGSGCSCPEQLAPHPGWSVRDRVVNGVARQVLMSRVHGASHRRRASCCPNVSYSFHGSPPLKQLPAPALNSVSPQNSAGSGVAAPAGQICAILFVPGCRGIASSPVRPTLNVLSPSGEAPTPPRRFRGASRVASTGAFLPPSCGIAACVVSLPCVLRICVILPAALVAPPPGTASTRADRRRIAPPVSAQAMRS